MSRFFKDQSGEVKCLDQLKDQWKAEGVAQKKAGLNYYLKVCLQQGVLVELKRKRFYGKQVYYSEGEELK